MSTPSQSRSARTFTAGLMLAVIAGVLMLAHLAIPCASPKQPRMSSKFDAMCKPPVFTAKANAEFLLKVATPEPLRLPAFAAALSALAALALLLRRPETDPHRPRFSRLPRIRDGSRLPFVTSCRVLVPAFAPARDH